MNRSRQPALSEQQLDAEIRRYLVARASDVEGMPSADDSIRKLTAATGGRRDSRRGSPVGQSQDGNGQGRSRTMFNAVKVAAMVAIISVGGLVAARVVVGPGPGIGAPAAEAPSPSPSPDLAMVPTWVTGELALAPTCADATITTEPGVRHEVGYRCEGQTWTLSDPRLTGTATSTWNADVYRVEGAEVTVSAGTYDLRNDGGSWLCHYAADLAHGSGLFTNADNDETVACIGSGGYEGLTAILVNDWTKDPVTITGLIFPGEAPPVP
jgi:hypothetical protein